MTQLFRVTSWGISAIRRRLRELGSLPTEDEMRDGWFEPHPSGIRADQALAVAKSVDPTRIRGGDQDGDLAAVLHARWQLARCVAAENRVWPWLAVVPFRAYTMARWTAHDGRIVAERVGAVMRSNAIARLWWSAEYTRLDNVQEVRKALGLSDRGDDPYSFSRQLLEPSIHKSLANRQLVRIRALAIVLLAHAERGAFTSEQLEQFCKSIGLAMSTVTPEYFDCTVGGNPYHLETSGVVELFSTIERIIGDRFKRRRWLGFLRPRTSR